MQKTHNVSKRNWAAKLMAIVVVVSMVASTLVLFAPEASARTGSDSYGYTFKDSAESDGPVFNDEWIELVGHTDATLLISSSTDAGQSAVDIGFTFEFYENEYTTWGNGGDNGYINLGSAGYSYYWTPYSIPYAALNVAIFGGWFDGGFCRASNSDAGVYYATVGTAPNRKLVVQYEDQGAWYPSVYQCPGSAAADALTWQIVLHEGSNAITINYEDAQGGYGSDNEYLTAGIQGKPAGELTGLQYVYRGSPSQVSSTTSVLYSPPPPPRNDLRLASTVVPDPVSLIDDNVMSATVTNKGVNCGAADGSETGTCDPVAETDISVTAQVFSVSETEHKYAMGDDSTGELTKMTPADGGVPALQGQSKWTKELNDGKGNHNYGDEGTDDDAWSSGRKSETLGGMFNDNHKMHYDGTNIIIADKGSDSVKKLDVSTNTVTTVIAASTTYLNDVVDVTEDGTYYYTLARTSGQYSYVTKVCKWLISDTTATPDCNTTSVRYGTSLTYYAGELFVIQTSSSSSYRKVIILDASDMSLEGNFAYSSGVSSWYFAQGIDVDETTGDLYIAYRDYNGRTRQYERSSSGAYSASNYNQIYTNARYHHALDVQDDKVYTSGYYYSSWYGGMRSYDTGAVSGATALWTSYSTANGGYKGSVAVTSDGDIYVASNYLYNYYSFYNFDDKIWIHKKSDSGSYSGTADTTLGPNPASLSALSTPAYDTSSSIGMSMTFKISYQFYYRWEGAYLESSVDGGSNWAYVSGDQFTEGGYYGTTFNTYGNPLNVQKDAWTYYNTNDRYTYNTHTAPWKTQTLNLDAWTGYDDVRFRWTVGFNQYDNTYYYDSYFRLDDVVITIKGADQTYATDTQTIDSLDYKASTSVDFFTTTETAFNPKADGLNVGDKVAVMINIADNGGDQDMSNNRDVQFREVKYVIFADDFEDGDISNWEIGKIKYGSGDTWHLDDGDSNAGTYSMGSGFRNEQSSLPGDNYAASPSFDLTLPVAAEMQMFISYYAYFTYDGYQVQITTDGGDNWELLEPNADDERGYFTIANYAYYNNPLRGQKAYAYYGTSTGFTYSPDPQKFIKATFDLTEYCGSSDVKFRVVAAWGTLPQSWGFYNSFMRFDDVAVTGLVYNDNVALKDFELPDPIGIDATIPLETTVLNAGLNPQGQGDATVRMQLGPMGIETYDASDDMESYADEAAATTAGYAASEACNTTYSTCSYWGYYGGSPGFVMNTDEGDDVETNSWGSDGSEFQMYYGGGSAWVTTPAFDFSGAAGDLTLTMKHRYNFDYYSGYTSYNGGQAHISTDGGSTWELFVPSSGYPGTMYNYAPYGNPLYGQAGFVHCGSCPGSGAAGDDADEYISTEFDMSAYVDMTDVKLKFIVGMYRYQWPGDGEHWHIDSLSFTGTGMESVAYEEQWDIIGTGPGGEFSSGEKQVVGTDYHFQVPGNYKIQFDAWIGDSPADGDDYNADNSLSLARETMFTVASTTGNDVALSNKNDENNDRWYDSDWHSSVDGGPKGGYQWVTSGTGQTASAGSDVWWTGTDAYGSSYDGDDVSLVSPVFDLSKATSAKLVLNHRYFMHGWEYTWGAYYYDGARIEISTDAGDTWNGLEVTSGQGYTGTIYNYAYYGNPLRGERGFVMDSGGWTESQCRLDNYLGEGNEQLQIRFRLGGTFFVNPTYWEIDSAAIYGLGFDLAQTSESSPYTLELGESFEMSTSFKNQGMGDLGPGGAVEAAYARAYVNDLNGNKVWSESKPLESLDMAYYEGGETFAGDQSADYTFNFPGLNSAGVYTAGVHVADAAGNTLSDLFNANNDASHMLIVGRSADMGTPLLTGGENWAATEGDVDGAMGVSWDRTGVATDTLAVSIGTMGEGFSPASAEVQVGTTVTWTNTDTGDTHTVTDRDGQFDSFDIEPGASWEMTFTEVGTFTYYCKHHSMMEGTIIVAASQSADELVKTNYVKVWSATAYLVFWANFDMSDDSAISIYAQKKGSELDGEGTLGLWDVNGFAIIDGADHEEVGNSLTGDSDGWNPYYMSLDSKKLGYSSLNYNPTQDNEYSFVFRARGVEGTAHIGGVELIRTLDTGFYLGKDDESKLTYDIFPSLAVEVDYFAKNIGTLDNTFSMTPELLSQGKSYDGPAFDISINVMMNGETFEDITATQNDDGTWTHEFDMAPDDEALITVRFGAPDYNEETGEPSGNRKFDVRVNGFDVESDEVLREPVAATLFIKPSQFVLEWADPGFDRQAVVEGEPLSMTVKAWNEGNYASNVLVVFYVLDNSGDAYSTPEGVKRMTRIADTTIPLMEPKPVMENDGVYKTWYEATGVWDEAYLTSDTAQEYSTETIYAMINPDAEEQDVEAGVKTQDEYLNQRDDNDATGTIAVVKSKDSTPSFTVGLIGLSVAALIASIGASLRREEE